ncbi:MAG: hypothetical protein WBK20_06965 [Spirochaetota bacterium]
MNRLSIYIFELAFRFPQLRYIVWAVIISVSIYAGYHLFYQEVVTYPVGWERSVVITPYTLKVKSPFAVSKGNVVAVAFEGTEKNENGIYVILSLNGGKDFLPAYKLSGIDPTVAVRPHIAISNNGHIACTWHNLVDSKSKIFITISNDLGATWSKPVALSLQTDESMLSQVFYDSTGGLHLFYHGSVGGRLILYHAFSPDELQFTRIDTIADIATEYRGIFFPAIVFEGDSIYLVFQAKILSGGVLSDDLFFVYSDNNGKSFSRPKRITLSPANDSSPYLYLHKDVLYCVYMNNEQRHWEVRLLRGYNKGKQWELDPIIITRAEIDCYAPKLVASSDDEMLIVWNDMRERYQAVFGKKYSLIDGSLSNPLRISDANVTSYEQFPVIIKKQVLLFWNSNQRLQAKFSDISVLPPNVYSRTHPENVWTRQTNAIIEWDPPVDESGIAGYAVIYNDLPTFDPTVQNVEGPIRKYVVPDLKDGITYFHIRAIDKAGNYSRTIHYPLLVSSTPLPMPTVSSPTHPEGTRVDNPVPVLQWTVEQRDRLKGFYYAIAKDAIVEPSTFTTADSVTLESLPKGRYFFSIRPVDMTNMKGRMATYEIVIGDVGKADAAYYEQLAKGVKPPEELPGKIPGKVRIQYPVVLFNIPFKEIYASSFYKFTLLPKNILQKQVMGYSVVVSSQKVVPPFIVTHPTSEIMLTNVKPGNYTITARMRYIYYINGKVAYKWSAPSYTTLVVKSAYTSPLMNYAENLNSMIKDRQLVTIIYSIGMLCIVLAIGMSTRIAFSLHAMWYRIFRIF